MAFDFLTTLNSHLAYAEPIGDRGVARYFRAVNGKSFHGQRAPLAEELMEETNFGLFAEKLRFNYDVPLVFGSSVENRTAAFLEDNFQETIELTGIISFTTSAGFMTVTTRRGTFDIRAREIDGVLVEPCVLLRLRDFQKDCIYVAGTSSNALEIGATALASLFGGPVQEAFLTEDALVVQGSMKTEMTDVGGGCIHISEPEVDVESISVAKLRLIDEDLV